MWCEGLLWDITDTCNTVSLLSCHVRFESEFVLKGYYFVKGHMRITVSQVCRVSNYIVSHVQWLLQYIGRGVEDNLKASSNSRYYKA